MKESHRILLAILMIVVGSLGLQNNIWEQRMQTRIDYIEEERHTSDDFYPYVFTISKKGDYTRVNLTSSHIIVYESLSSSKAVQWAIDNIPNNTGIEIVEDIMMDGNIDMMPHDKKSYSMFAKGGYLDFTKIVEKADNPPKPFRYELHTPNRFFEKIIKNKELYGITAFDSKFVNCTIDNSVLYHCILEDSNVTRTFVYASLFEYWYTYAYVDFSDVRASYNTTTWWKNP